ASPPGLATFDVTCSYSRPILLILLGALTAFIVPLVLLLLGALSPSGQVITYTLSPSGSIKKKSRSARR
ncbi:MAG: hypothetical protein ACTH34_10755, partial [Microbacterium gubbeenense]|uniref:hypothetical protein n=1 Tax=Microbacterium gubbeenense TaxID=159896 RepID=UPI003F996F94